MLNRQTKFLVTFFAVTLLPISYACAYDNENDTVSANDENETNPIPIMPINNSNSTIQDDIPSPKKQTEQGVPPLGVICKYGFKLVLKASDGSPSCLHLSSIDKLVERGWAQSQDWREHD